MIRPSRRLVLGWTAALAGLATLGRPRAATLAGTAHEELLSCLSDRRAAARIGRAALAELPHLARDIGPLSAALRAAAAEAAGSGGSLRAGLARRVRDDFAAGRVVTVRGWLLSETETRLCALAALADG